MKSGYTIQRWSQQDVAYLNTHFKTLSDEEMAQALNRTPASVQTKRMELQLKKEKKLPAVIGVATRFKKGHKPVIVPHHLKKRRTDGWTVEQEQYLKEHWPMHSATEISAVINRGKDSIYDKAAAMGLKKDPAFLHRLGKMATGRRRSDSWPEEQLEYLKTHYATKSAAEIAVVIPRSIGAIKTMARHLGLKTDKETLIRLCKVRNAGMFNSQHSVGSITTRTTKAGLKSLWIKLGPNQWQQLSRYIWLKAGNEIPEGHAVCFKDGDSTNCDISNLELHENGRHIRRRQTAAKRAARAKSKLEVAARRIEEQARKRELKRQAREQKKEEKRQAQLLAKLERQKISEERKAAELRRIELKLSKPVKEEKSFPDRAKKVRLKVAKSEFKTKRRALRIQPEQQVATIGTEQPKRSANQARDERRSKAAADRALIREKKAKEAEKQREAQRLLKAEQSRKAKAEKERQRLQKEWEDRRVLPTRKENLAEKIALRIDEKTTVFIRPDQDPEEVRERYRKKQVPDRFANLPPTYQF